jgi:hypothetical protein
VEKIAAASSTISATPAARPNDRASKLPIKTAGPRVSSRWTDDSTAVSFAETVAIVTTRTKALQEDRQIRRAQ